MKKKKALNMPFILMLLATHLIFFIGGGAYLLSHPLLKPTLWLSFAFILMSGLGITVGYHRLFSHRSYRATWIVRFIFMVFGTIALQGSVFDWASGHRRHHRYVDTPKDPYNIHQGFWYAHLFWMFYRTEYDGDYSEIKDLTDSPMLRWQDRHYVSFAFALTFALPALIASLWHDPWGGLLFAGFGRWVINSHFTWFINSAAHTFGSQPYDDRGSARDNPWLALVTYGEGYHNFHHQFAVDYRNGIRWYDFDPSKWVIRLLNMLGLTSDLRRIPDSVILKYKIAIQEKKLQNHLSGENNRVYDREKVHSQLQAMLLPSKNALLEAARHFESMRKRFYQIKLIKLKRSLFYKRNCSLALCDHLFAIYHQRVKEAKKSLQQKTAEWQLALQASQKLHAS